MAGDRLDDGVGDLAALRSSASRTTPGAARPRPCTLDLDVQLDVLRETRPREVAGAHQCLGAHDFEPCVGDVGLRVELVLVVDAALDMPGAERVEDRWDPVQEGIRLLVLLDAPRRACRVLAPETASRDGLASPMGGLRPHQDPDLVEPLPLAVESEQCADLEVPGRDVERLRDAGPLLQVPEPGPAGDAVVDDEELAALGVSGHGVLGRCGVYPRMTPYCSDDVIAEIHQHRDSDKGGSGDGGDDVASGKG